VLTALLAASFAAPSFRMVTVAVALPYFLFWAIGFSYDFRNLASAVPLLAVAAAFGVGVCCTRLEPLFPRAQAFRSAHRVWFAAGLSGLAALLWLNHEYPSNRLRAFHTNALSQSYGNREVNIFLTRYPQLAGRGGSVLTNYAPMADLPNVKKCCSTPLLNRNATLTQYMNRMRDPRVRFLLIDHAKTSRKILEYVERGVQDGGFEPVFRLGKDRYTLYRRLRPPERIKTRAAREIAGRPAGTARK
jgi:hypothetical protein